MIITSYIQAAEFLLRGNVGIVPADTTYGISCLTTNIESVEKIYGIKGRDFDKPFVILIPNIAALKNFGVDIENAQVKQAFEKYWPGPTSLVLNCPNPELQYLHRGLKSLAFRVPKDTKLLELLDKTGPIVSTSANRSGEAAVTTIEDAQKIFGGNVDFYLDGGIRDGVPSQVIKIDEAGEKILRSV